MPANHCKPHTEEAKAKMRIARQGKAAHWKRRQSREVDGVTHWICVTCKSYFPAGGFYKDKRTFLGIKTQCKRCHSQTSIASRDKERHRNARRDFARRDRAVNLLVYRERERLCSAKRIKTEKTKARSQLNAAVQAGTISRPDICSKCGKKARITGHHTDYSNPLDVVWLCYECHGKEHRND